MFRKSERSMLTVVLRILVLELSPRKDESEDGWSVTPLVLNHDCVLTTIRHVLSHDNIHSLEAHPDHISQETQFIINSLPKS
jgi:hypothetical protein